MLRRRTAFTLLELLAVIAIISILAAILFPVFARAKDSANRNADMSSMNEIRTALQLYRVDNGGYPPALLGYVGRYASGPQAGNVIPADQINGFLFSRRVRSVNTFRPVIRNVSPNLTTTAVWPNQDPRAVGTAPVSDTNGDGAVTPVDDIAGARQAYGPTIAVRARPGSPVGPTNPVLEYYQISGYDVAELPRRSGSQRWEIRYALFWSNFSIGNGPGLGGGSPFDDPRQLGYSDPPDSTVITWNSYYRDFDANGNVPHNKRDIVLFLGGAARPYDSADIATRSWRALP